MRMRRKVFAATGLTSVDVIDTTAGMTREATSANEGMVTATTGPDDVWIGDDQLIHRMGFGFGPNETMTMDFTDFGTAVDVQAPPADQTVDAFKLLKQHG